MTDNPTIASPEQERYAVAQLMFHIGVSLEMMYNTGANGGSGAAGLVPYPGYASINSSLVNYFHYRDDYRIVEKALFTNQQWRDTLMCELDKLHPILYTGADNVGGHAFVCDGYDEQQKMHFNFGWRGIGDGYYEVDSISPRQGGVGGNGSYTFNLVNTALLGAVPDYDMLLGNSLLYFQREGGTDSVLFAVNDNVDAPWSVNCDADWLTIEEADFERAGWLKISASENTTGDERVAVVTFVQGDQTKTLRVGQAYFNPDDFCRVIVELKSSGYPGWRGDSHITLESKSGFVYKSLRLESGTFRSDTVAVAPAELHVVWHGSSSADRFAGYTVKNKYGETVLSVDNAAEQGGDDIVARPCSSVDVEMADRERCHIYPNPTSGMVTIDGEAVTRVDILDITGRQQASFVDNIVDISALSCGVYFLRVVTPTSTNIYKILKNN